MVAEGGGNPRIGVVVVAYNAASTSTCTSAVENVTAISQPTSLSTSLSGGGQSGPDITVPAGTAVTDVGTVSGTDAATAGGTVSYAVYSDENCTDLVADAGTSSVVDGVGAPSDPITLQGAGTYYWEASYSGDTANAPSLSRLGSEIEIVVPVPTCRYGWIHGLNGRCSAPPLKVR